MVCRACTYVYVPKCCFTDRVVFVAAGRMMMPGQPGTPPNSVQRMTPHGEAIQQQRIPMSQVCAIVFTCHMLLDFTNDRPIILP